jgi:hypothetical protein
MPASRRSAFSVQTASIGATESSGGQEAVACKARIDALLRRMVLLRWVAPMRISSILVGFGCFVSYLTGATGREFKLLDPHSETKVERVEKFVAAEVFKAGSRIGGRTLGAVGWNFAEHFLGTVEENVPEASLKGWTLLYTASDKSLIEALGGEEITSVPFLAYVHRVMDAGDRGPSHLDWRSNFAYVRSPIDRRLWAVHWNVNYANEWNIGAVYVPHPHLDWRSDSRLFGGSIYSSSPR